jgi:3-hydroxyisobutyrate dehydrogenase-like beta-hydroxyacid dehydrogenase
MGAPGNAARTKLAVNLVLQINRAALAEGIALAERMGLSAASYLEVLRSSPAYSSVMDAKGIKMLRGDYAPESRTAQTAKDARLIQDEALRLGQRLPMMEANAALLSAAMRVCGEDADPASIIEALRMQRPM